MTRPPTHRSSEKPRYIQDSSDTNASAADDGVRESAYLQFLVDGAAEALENDAGLGSGWVEMAASFVARLIRAGDHEEIEQVGAVMRKLAATATRAREASVSDVAHREKVDAALRAHATAAQLDTLAAVASSGLVLSALDKNVKVENGSLAAQILVACAEHRIMAAGHLRDLLGVHQTQVSRECRKLLDLGLVTRRKYGRNVDWSLTPAGERVAAAQGPDARGAASGPVPDVQQSPEPASGVFVSTADEFAQAARSLVPLIEVDIAGITASARWTGTSVQSYKLVRPVHLSPDTEELFMGIFDLPAAVQTENSEDIYIRDDIQHTP